MKRKTCISISLTVLAVLACNLPSVRSDVLPTQTVPAPSMIEESATVLTETDECKLFDVARASALLGESVVPPSPLNDPGYSVCNFFTNTGKGIYITITMGDQARRNLLNEISQYQKGCTIGYSAGSNTATPFPPEIEAMIGKSVLDLYHMDVQLQVQCGVKIEELPEFGPDAYGHPGQGMFQIGSVVIASGDNLYSFGYADPALDMAAMVEKAKEVTRSVFAQIPTINLTPIGIPTQVGSMTLPSSPTLVIGPSPVDTPTLISVPTLVQGPSLVPTSVAPPTLIPTMVGKPTKVSQPTSIGPTPVGPTPVGPTPIQ